MKYIIDEDKLTKVLSTYLKQYFNGIYYDWANFNCGMGECCDMYAIGFILPDRSYDDYLFKLVDGENYDDMGDYPEELMGELPEPCHSDPNVSDPRFDTILISEELEDVLKMFGGIDVWGGPFLKMINHMSGSNANKIYFL